MSESIAEGRFLTALPIEKFIYLTAMLNKLKKKAKKKLPPELYEIYQNTMNQHNETFKEVNKEQEMVTLEFGKEQIQFLQFFTHSTSSQMPDKGQKKLLEGLAQHFHHVLSHPAC